MDTRRSENQEEKASVVERAGDKDHKLAPPRIREVAEGYRHEHRREGHEGPHVPDDEGVRPLELSRVDEGKGHTQSPDYGAQGFQEDKALQIDTGTEHLPILLDEVLGLGVLLRLHILEVQGDVEADDQKADELNVVEGPDALHGDAAKVEDEDSSEGWGEDAEELHDRGPHRVSRGPFCVCEAVRDEDVLGPEDEGHRKGG